MYNLAKRKFLPKVGDTPGAVGPNTYYFDSYKSFKHNYAPFLSDTARGGYPEKCDYGDAFYDVVLRHHIKGGNSIRDRSKREFYQVGDVPGPADYDPKIQKKQPAPEPRPPGRGRLYLCKPPRGSVNSIPSIPTKINENGYFMNMQGVVVKNPPDDHDHTIGPAFYNVASPFPCTNMYKGCVWSKKRAKRDVTIINKNPGPGTYDISSTIGKFNERDEYVREMAKLFGFVPRYMERMEMELLKENKPGPGNYDIKTSAINLKKSLSIHPQPFISAADRWNGISSNTPSPTAYNISGNLKKRPVSLGHVPFGSEAPRFVSEITKSPSAANYNVLNGTIQDQIAKKSRYFGTVEAPFNITAKRKMTFVADDSYFMPSSADYLVQPLQMTKDKAASCNFRSTTCRSRRIKQPYEAGPATYDIAETFNKNRNRKSHNVGKVPFQSWQPKHPKPRVPDKPSPADYSSHKMFGGRDLSFGTSLRWGDNYDDFPGPGTYNISPVYDCAIYKSHATHNLRLKENVLRKKLRLPPGKTWEAWYKEIKLKRKLKCYEKEGLNIDHFLMLFADV